VGIQPKEELVGDSFDVATLSLGLEIPYNNSDIFWNLEQVLCFYFVTHFIRDISAGN